MKRIRKENVLPFLLERSLKERVFCPQDAGDGDLLLMPLGEGIFTGGFGKPLVSAKIVLFPQNDEIMSFIGGDISKLTDRKESLVFGMRPCDINALRLVDRFMERDGYRDPHYFARRDKMTTVVAACREPPSDTCFCTDAGRTPYLDNGFDLELFDQGDYYIAEPGSERGEVLLDGRSFEEARQEDRILLSEFKKDSVSAVKCRPGVKRAMEALGAERAEAEFWEKLALRCLNCGGCAYVCPTCTCFHICDFPDAGGYIRRRGWDACIHEGFSRETSGHNPRPTQGSRLARRFEHKFRYDPLHFGEPGCVGCGRCSEACPVGLGAIEFIRELEDMQTRLDG